MKIYRNDTNKFATVMESMAGNWIFNIEPIIDNGQKLFKLTSSGANTEVILDSEALLALAADITKLATT